MIYSKYCGAWVMTTEEAQNALERQHRNIDLDKIHRDKLARILLWKRKEG